MTDPRYQSPLERLADLESRLAKMALEVKALASELRAAPSALPPVAPPAPPAPAPAAAPSAPPPPPPLATPKPFQRPSFPSKAPQPERADLEQLIGRYGTVGIATLAILLGVGAFLQWAIAKGLLGPEMRVILGALAAVALALTGLKLRARGTVRFGNVLLAIALAVAHVVAWAAGPSLHLIPLFAALTLAAAASIALSMLALQDGEEWLFTLGVGGALIAPFVTLESAGGIGALMLYGWMIITAAIVALRDPEWYVARAFLTAGASTYVAAGFAFLHRPYTPVEVRIPAIFALGLALSATLLAEPVRRRILTRQFLVVMGLALAAAMEMVVSEWQGVTVAVMGTLALLLLRRRAMNVPGDKDGIWDATILPIAFMLIAIRAFRDPSVAESTMLLAPWLLLGVVLTQAEPAEKRGFHLALAFTAIELLVLLAADGRAVPTSFASSLVAIGVLLTFAELRQPALLIPLVLAVLSSSFPALDALESRRRYDYIPFTTLPSLAGLATTAMWIAIGRLTPPERAEAPFLRPAGVVAAFVWGHLEFSHAFSRDLATFLLITYYALFGVVAIGIGRSREIPILRHAGLAVAIFAAVKAVLQASDLSSIGLRVGSYLIVGAFLLGVGYWYRAASDRGVARTADVR